MLLQMGLSVFLQIVMRYAFHSAITWLDELVHVEVVLLTFFGAALGVKHGSHMCVDVLKKRLSGKWSLLVEMVSHLVVAIYVFLVVSYGAGLIERMTVHPHFTPTLRIPKHYLYFLVCAGLALIGIRCIVKIIELAKMIVTKRNQEVGP